MMIDVLTLRVLLLDLSVFKQQQGLLPQGAAQWLSGSCVFCCLEAQLAVPGCSKAGFAGHCPSEMQGLLNCVGCFDRATHCALQGRG